MTLRSIVFLLAILPWAAVAQTPDLPALFDVAGVASDDVLNVRERPLASSEKIAELAPDQSGVEVVALDEGGLWGRVNVGEAAGWVSMTYLVRQPGQDDYAFLTPLRCFGTEPFWSMTVTESDVTFTDEGMGSDPVTSPLEPVGTLPWSPAAPIAAGAITGFVDRAECSDGMSDRDYGWRIDLLQGEVGDRKMLSGCCTLQN